MPHQLQQAIDNAKDDDIRIVGAYIEQTDNQLIQALLQRIINEILASKGKPIAAPERPGPGGL